MKKAIIGGSFSIVGALCYLAIMIFVGNNLVSGWGTPPGRFLTTVSETGMSFPFLVSICILVVGLAILTIEYLKKEE